MAKIIVLAQPTKREMRRHLQSLVDDEESAFCGALDYSVFNRCKDMDIDDSEEGFVEGVLTDDGWRFEELVPPPKRSTVDEF